MGGKTVRLGYARAQVPTAAQKRAARQKEAHVWFARTWRLLNVKRAKKLPCHSAKRPRQAVPVLGCEVVPGCWLSAVWSADL